MAEPFSKEGAGSLSDAIRQARQSASGSWPKYQLAHLGRMRLALAPLGAVALIVVLSLSVRGPSSLRDFQATSRMLPPRSTLSDSVLVTPGGLPQGTYVGTSQSRTILATNPAAGRWRSLNPFPRNTLESFPWATGGNDVIAVNGLDDVANDPQIGTAEAFSPERPNSPVALGRATYVVNAERLDAVWLVITPDGPGSPFSGETGCSIEQVSTTGRVVIGRRSFPCGWRIDGPAPGGLLVTRAPLPKRGQGWAPGTLSRWNPVTDHVYASYGERNTAVDVDGDNGTVALWNQCRRMPCAPDLVTNLKTGQTRRLPALTSTWNSNFQYMLSPNGRFAALILNHPSPNTGGVVSPPCCDYGVHAVKSAILVYNLRFDRLVETRLLLAASVPFAWWSPDNGYLFVTRDLTHIEAVPLWSVRPPVRVLRVEIPRQAVPASESFLVLSAR